MTRLRIAVTGRNGQIARALAERARGAADIVFCARPECDLTDSASVARALEDARPDVIVNAAAHTAVDRAESEPVFALAVNAEGAAHVARSASRLGVPLVQLSTDYVFDGEAQCPYREDDPTRPATEYGRSKLLGERCVAAICPNSAILRTAWVYSPFGSNFVRTMLRLGETRSEIAVVADQRGAPTSAHDIADALLSICARLSADASPTLRGTFHMTGSDPASWADFARGVFAAAQENGRAPVRIRPIATADYPTPAARPKNSTLDCSRLTETFGVALPGWRRSLPPCVARILAEEK